MSNNKETFQRGDFQFEKGTGNVIFVPNENGAWNVQVMPEKPAPEGKGEGWEIVAMKSPNGYIHPLDYLSHTCAENRCEIYSVRREPDGEVFSVGDFIKVIETCRKGWSDPITGFLIIGDSMIAQFERWRQPINHLERMHKEIKVTEAPVPKQPLFTTSDGKDVYEGDETLWRVFITPHCYEMWRPYNMVRPDAPIKGEVYFSTEAAANEYVKWHKPGFSLYEIVNNSEMKGLSDETKGDVLYQFRLPKLIELAKSKIDKP